MRSLADRGIALQAPYLCAVKGAFWLAGACPQGTTRLAREARGLGLECKVNTPDDTVVVVRLRPANPTVDSSAVVGKYIQAFILKHGLVGGDGGAGGSSIAAQTTTADGVGEVVQLGTADILVDDGGTAQFVWTATVAPGFDLRCGSFVGSHRGASTLLSFERPVALDSATPATAGGGAQSDERRTTCVTLRTPTPPWRRAKPAKQTPAQQRAPAAAMRAAAVAGGSTRGAPPAKRARPGDAAETAATQDNRRTAPVRQRSAAQRCPTGAGAAQRSPSGRRGDAGGARSLSGTADPVRRSFAGALTVPDESELDVAVNGRTTRPDATDDATIGDDAGVVEPAAVASSTDEAGAAGWPGGAAAADTAPGLRLRTEAARRLAHGRLAQRARSGAPAPPAVSRPALELPAARSHEPGDQTLSAAAASNVPAGPPGAETGAATTGGGDAQPLGAATPGGERAAQCRAGGPGLDGLCAPTAVAAGLSEALQARVTAEEVQRRVTGSPAPSTWGAEQFVKAVRVFGVAMVVYRAGLPREQGLRVEPGAASSTIFLQMRRDGSHVEAARNLAADAGCTTKYVDVGRDGDAWMGKLRVLEGARARSGTTDGCAAGTLDASERGGGEPSGVMDANDENPAVAGMATLFELAHSCRLAVPAHIERWVRAADWHLQRIIAVLPDPHTGLRSHEQRWHLEAMTLCPKLEIMALRAHVAREHPKWWAQLGTKLPRVRGLLPPGDLAGFLSWDPKPLLREVRAFLAADKPAPAPPSTQGPCQLAALGRVAACRSALMGVGLATVPAPSEAVRDRIQAKLPEPARGTTVGEREFDALADGIDGKAGAVPDEERVTPDILLDAARKQRGTSAPGPDGWSGLFLRRIATLFPRSTRTLLAGWYAALRDTRDPLLAYVATHASVGAVPKPKGSGLRPIMIGQVVTRCIASCLVRRSKKELRGVLEKAGQYALSGVLPALQEPLAAVAECSATGVPWGWVKQDWSNAFNSVTQRALGDGVRRLADVAPELAATALRTYALPRGPLERVVHGRYPAGQSVLSVVKHPVGGDQGDPRTPPVFCLAAAPIEEAAARDGAWLTRSTPTPTVVDRLWRAMRDVAPSLEAAPAAEWRAALDEVLRVRPPPSGCSAKPAATVYMDDGLTAGWLVAALYRALRRSAHARALGLVDDPAENLVLVPAGVERAANVLLQPLRDAVTADRSPGAPPATWRVVTTMRVLGVDVTDPARRDGVTAAVRASMRQRVVEPLRRVIEELEGGGATRAAAFWVARTFVLPNLVYVQQVWGLHASPDAWAEADEALDDFCVALCPLDLRDRLHAGSDSLLRDELALPMRAGGLGIQVARRGAPVMAAQIWTQRAAEACGALPSALAEGYRPPDGVPGARPERVDPEALAERCCAELAARTPAHERRLADRRRELNRMRGGTWVFDGVPWDKARHLSDIEWDVAWRLAFGGLTDAQRARIDAPEEGFTWRGHVAERALQRAVEDVVPVRLWTWRQPGPDRLPPDHAARCAAAGESIDSWRRADIAFEFDDRHTVTVDVRTTNALSTSALRVGSAATHLTSQEARKRTRYAGYYANFRPLVIALSGAVTEESFSTLKAITRAAAAADGRRLGWEADRWAVLVLRRLQVAVVGAVASGLVRAPWAVRVADRPRACGAGGGAAATARAGPRATCA